MALRRFPTSRRATSSSLFAAPQPAVPPPSCLIANIDGGARGNPGPGGYGIIVRNLQGEVVAELNEFLGVCTNNVAEYSALLAALQFAIANRHPALKVISDSELLVKQVRGDYKVKSPDLKELHSKAGALIRKLEWFAVEHARREKNKDADRLANQAMDRGTAHRRTPAGTAAATAAPIARPYPSREYSGVVRQGKIELDDDAAGPLPDGTRVRIRRAD